MEKLDRKKIKYVIYTRKSMESSERQVQSLDDQLDYAKKRAKREQLEVVAVFFPDNANSINLSETHKRLVIYIS